VKSGSVLTRRQRVRHAPHPLRLPNQPLNALFEPPRPHSLQQGAKPGLIRFTDSAHARPCECNRADPKGQAWLRAQRRFGELVLSGSRFPLTHKLCPRDELVRNGAKK
jgi:hypothetical protein